jgi:hypothetical protein
MSLDVLVNLTYMITFDRKTVSERINILHKIIPRVSKGSKFQIQAPLAHNVNIQRCLNISLTQKSDSMIQVACNSLCAVRST